jgi:hypothetical protein
VPPLSLLCSLPPSEVEGPSSVLDRIMEVEC